VRTSWRLVLEELVHLSRHFGKDQKMRACSRRSQSLAVGFGEIGASEPSLGQGPKRCKTILAVGFGRQIGASQPSLGQGPKDAGGSQS